MIKITVVRTNTEERIELDVPEDTGIDDYQYIFASILSWITFTPEQIKELFNGETDDPTFGN